MRKLLLMLVTAASAAVLAIVPASAITGNFVPDNTHTYVGLVAFYDAQGQFTWRCTGSLLNSTTFLTAGHCTDQTGTGGEPVPTHAIVWVSQEGGAAYNPATGAEDPFTGYPNECKNSTAYPCAQSHTLLHYGYDGSLHKFGTDNHDVGMLILDTPVAPAASPGHSQFAQLPTANVGDTLATGAPVTATGYGVSGEKPAVVSYRERLMASEFIVNSHNTPSSGFNLQLSGNPGNGRGGTCFGDSGGPILNGSSDVVLGVNSFVLNGQCAGLGFAYRVDQPAVLSWINANMAD